MTDRYDDIVAETAEPDAELTAEAVVDRAFGTTTPATADVHSSREDTLTADQILDQL